VPDLEAQLADLAEFIEWPAMGEVRLPGPQPNRGRQARWLLAAAAVLVIVTTLFAYTPTRDAIAGWLNLHTVFHRVQNPPTPSPRSSGPAGARLDLGTQTTLEGARRQVRWTIAVPSFLGAPDEVYVKSPAAGPSGGEVTLVYLSRLDIRPTGITGVSVLVTEARGQITEPYFYKVLGPDVTVEQVTVGGHPGYWVSGRPHEFAFADSQGNPYVETLRLATNTLVFDDGGTVVRIEGDMTQAQALEIARSMT